MTKTISTKEAVSLTSIEAGRTVRLVTIEAGRALRSRLAAMGLVPGVEVRVVSSGGWGPFIVAVKDSRVMLGRGMSDKVYVA